MARSGKSLCERLGGYDAIAAFVTEYANRIRVDSKFARFGSRGTDKKRRDLQLNIDYMCKITGGTNYYMGRDIKTTHAERGITEAEWEANMRHMAESLDKRKVPQKEKEEVLALVAEMKKHHGELSFIELSPLTAGQRAWRNREHLRLWQRPPDIVTTSFGALIQGSHQASQVYFKVVECNTRSKMHL